MDNLTSWEREDTDPAEAGPGLVYVCTACKWRGRGALAAAHHQMSGHSLRGRDWPATWPDAKFGARPDRG